MLGCAKGEAKAKIFPAHSHEFEPSDDIDGLRRECAALRLCSDRRISSWPSPKGAQSRKPIALKSTRAVSSGYLLVSPLLLPLPGDAICEEKVDHNVWLTSAGQAVPITFSLTLWIAIASSDCTYVCNHGVARCASRLCSAQVLNLLQVVCVKVTGMYNTRVFFAMYISSA